MLDFPPMSPTTDRPDAEVGQGILLGDGLQDRRDEPIQRRLTFVPVDRRTSAERPAPVRRFSQERQPERGKGDQPHQCVTSGGTLPVADPRRGGYHVPTGDRTSDPRIWSSSARLASVIIAGFLVIVSLRPAPADEGQSAPQRDDAVRRHGLDPSSPLEFRVKYELAVRA